MNNHNIDDTVASLRRIVTTGAVAAAVLLVGAVLLMASSALFSVARFSPFGAWSVLAVLGVAGLAGLLVWRFGPGQIRLRRAAGPVLATDILYREPPPVPVRAQPTTPALLSSGGRLGAEAMINGLVQQCRYAEALAQLDSLDQHDPELRPFCAAKRRAIHRRQAREGRSVIGGRQAGR